MAASTSSSSAPAAPATKLMILKSSDGEEFEVEESVVCQSETIKNMIEDDLSISEGIPLPNVTSEILAQIVTYLKKHGAPKKEGEGGGEGEDLSKWDAEFVKSFDQRVLFEVVSAANYLNIKNLLDLTCQTIADRIKDKQPEEVREMFNIVNDFTPEEEAEVRRENQWAFDTAN